MTATGFDHTGLMQGRDYAGEECAGWVAQRKWDGVFAGWDGERLFTLEGNTMAAPDFFLAGLPDFPLACELVAEKEGANFANGLIKQRGTMAAERWRNARLMVFDVPQAQGGIWQRLSCFYDAALPDGYFVSEFAAVAPVTQILSRRHLRSLLEVLLRANGEGLMIQPADLPYSAGRTGRLRKVKRQSLHFLKLGTRSSERGMS